MIILKTFGVFLLFCTISFLSLAVSTDARTSPEKESVNTAVQAIKACMHWAGEVGDQNEERNEQILNGINHDCPIAKKEAALIYKFYPDNTVLSEPLLELNDLGYLTLSAEEKAQLCQLSLAVIKEWYDTSNQENPFVRLQCPELAKKIYGK